MKIALITYRCWNEKVNLNPNDWHTVGYEGWFLLGVLPLYIRQRQGV